MLYLFLADGFEEVEALLPTDYLRRADIDVITVGVTGKTVKGAHGITVFADITANEISLDEKLSGILLPGGMPGTLNLQNSPDVISAIKYAADNNLLISAICAAPSILGKMNILDGKKAVCFPSFEKELKGAVVTDDFCVTDGNIITAKGAGAAAEFAFAIITYLKSAAAALNVKQTVQTPE